MNYSFIINPNSGNNKKKNIIKNALQKYPSEKISVKFTKYPGHAAEIAKQELQDGVPNIIAVGGDGTVNEVASQLINTNVNFGLIPMGSGNGFARSLNLPLKPKQALETIFKNKIIEIDVGKVNDRFFFAVSGVGIDAYIASRFQGRKIRGAIPYFIVGTKAYFNYSYPGFTIINKDEKVTANPFLITIANTSQFGNGAKIAPQAELQDGLLDICIVQKMSVIKTINAAIKMFRGRINDLSTYSTFTTDKIEIASQNGEIDYHVDGEPLKTNKNLVFQIVPKSLKVITV